MMMKQLLAILLIVACSIGNSSAQQTVAKDTVATAPKGKEYLLDVYQRTFNDLKKSTAGLSEAQLKFKPAPDKWSVSQVLEHIVLTEPKLFAYAKEMMVKPANPERKAEVKMKDEDVIKFMTDRSKKVKASEDLIGTGKYVSATAAISDLDKEQQAIVAYLSSISEDDLRNHIADTPFGPTTAYQTFLYIPGHIARHILQIEEIKADKNFNKIQ